jgi:hypothetical protein
VSPPPQGDDAADGETSGHVALLAADLRELRVRADSPTYKELQAKTGISRTVLADAFAGRKLPSARTLDRVVRACGGDARPWLDRRDSIADREKTTPATRSVTRRIVILVAIIAFVAGATLSAVTTALVMREPAAPSDAVESAEAATGDDPATTPCIDDAAVATSAEGAAHSLIEIIWSNKSQAGWGRITRYDGLIDGNTVTIAIYPETAPHGPDRQEATEHNVQGAYTGLIVRPTPETLLCAEGSFTVDGESFDVGAPLCV